MKLSVYAKVLLICWALLFINTNTLGRLEGYILPAISAFTIDTIDVGGR